jgi:hypothetical protein
LVVAACSWPSRAQPVVASWRGSSSSRPRHTGPARRWLRISQVQIRSLSANSGGR